MSRPKQWEKIRAAPLEEADLLLLSILLSWLGSRGRQPSQYALIVVHVIAEKCEVFGATRQKVLILVKV